MVLAFLDKNPNLMLFFALGLGIFLLSRPSPDKFSEEYQLTESEKRQLW
jgi:hypothetical protein